MPPVELANAQDFGSLHARFLRRSVWKHGLAIGLPLVVALASVLSGSLGAALLGGYLGLLGAALGVAQARRNRWPVEVPDPVEVRDGRLLVGGRVVARREELLQGNIWFRGEDEPVVRLERRNPILAPPLDVQVESEREGIALLGALGLDPSQSVARFRVPSRFLLLSPRGNARVLAAALSVLALMVAAVAWWPGGILNQLWLPLYMLLAAAAAWPTAIVVGPDGVLVSWLGRGRFIRYHEIEWVALTEAGFTLMLRSEETIALHLERGRDLDPDLQLQMAGRRIEEALASCGQRRDTAPVPILERGARPVRDWLRDLRALVRPGGYRALGLDAARLWRLVEDPLTAPAQRVGAAVALGRMLDATGRRRLRVAAEATASPRVRCVLEAVAEEREEALMDALDAIDQEPPRAREA